MHHSTFPIRRAVAIPVSNLLVAVLLCLASCAPAWAQANNPLAQRWADARVQGEEIRFLLQAGRITADEARSRTAAMNDELLAIRKAMNKLPRDAQTDITRQAETLFQVRIVPLHEQWTQALQQKRQDDQARDAARRVELQTDAEQSGKLQAARTLLRERLQRGEISQDEMARADREAEQAILSLHRKYEAYGPAWGNLFSQTEAAVAGRVLAETRVRLRLEDARSEVGRDAHRAADLTLSMQRNQVFRYQQAMTPQEEQSLNSAAQTMLNSIQQKYGPTSRDAADFRDRVARLVQAGASIQRPQWEKDAIVVREAASARRAVSAAIQPVPAPSAGPQPVPTPLDPAPSPAIHRASAPPPRSRVTAPTAQTPAQVRPSVIYRPSAAPVGGGLSWTPILVVLAVGGLGAGAYIYRGRRASAPPRYSDIAASYMPPPAVTEQPARAAEDADAAASIPETEAGGGSLKQQLFAQQRAKYQVRYNDALDEVTSASMALTNMAPVLTATQGNLRLLSKSLYERIQSLIAARCGGLSKLLLNAAILMPVWRLLKRSGWLLRVGIVIGVWLLWGAFVRALTQEGPTAALMIYAMTFVVSLFLERHTQLRMPLAQLKKNGDDFKNLKLSYIHKDQRPEVHKGESVYWGASVLATDKTPSAREDVFPQSLGSGAFIIGVGTMANYRIEPGGSTSLLATARDSEFMNRHGSLLTEAMGEQGGFAATTLPSFSEYGQAVWRKRRAANLMPQLEKLVKDVERIEKIWEETYVSDAVFEFLFRSMDMFNMRDAATPPGMLLYGFPGNGKKHLAQKIAETLSARFEEVDPSKLSSADDIKALWASCSGIDPVVLFVPNTETVFPRLEGGASGRDALEWVAEWEKHEPHQSRVWVVMTARSDQTVDQTILDHIGQDSKIEISPPDAAGRMAVFRLACRQYQVSTLPPDSAIRATGGTSIHDLHRIVMAAKRASTPRQPAESHWLQAVRTVRGAEAKFRDETKTWERLVLPPKVKEQLQVACRILQDAEEYLKKGAKVPNILLYGPPGTGKTEIARTIANEGGVNFMDQKLSDLKGVHIGVSAHNVREMFEKARAQAPTVLFMDEIDGAAKKRGSEGADQYTEEIVNELLAQMEGSTKSDRPVFVLAATNRPDTMDPAVLRRFQHKIEIPLPDEEGRREILKGLLQGKQLAPGLDIDELSRTVAKRTNGQAGAGLRDVVDRAMARAVAEADSPVNIRLTVSLILQEVEELPASGSDKVDASARWDTLVVSDHTLTQLRQLSDALRHMETFQRQGIDPPRGAVLWGPPGTGKTQIAKTLANESGVPFMFRTGADLGQTAQTVRSVFDDARAKAPCILFIDEFEKAAESRDKGGSAEIVTELLAQMQGAKRTDRPVFVLAATNYLDRMDDAILSRFTYRIEIPNPTVEQREKLFTIVLNKYPRAQFDVPELAAELARKGGGLSGRDINDVVVRASQAAAQRALLAGTPDRVELTREDLTNEVSDMVKSRSDAVDTTARWETLVLSDETLKKLKQISTAVRNIEDRIKQGIEPPRGAVLFGPTGTGKTQIARTLANESGVQFVSATAKDLTGQYVGESTQKVAKLFADARKKAPCILFLDEFDNATSSRAGNKGSGFSGEVVTQLLAEMDGVKATGRPVFVLAATNHLEHIDDAVLSRFTYRIEVPNPTREQRERLFEIFLGKIKRVDFDIKDMAAELAKRSGEIGGRQIGDLVRKASQAAAQRAEESGQAEIVLSREDLLDQLAPAGRQVTDQDLTRVWAEIVLKPDVKESLLAMIRLFNSGNKAAPKGMLLHGPPGTGKTEIGRLLARSTGCKFLETDLTKLKGSHVGESGQNVKALWEEARSHGRAIIFVDECDGVFARRGGANTDAAAEEITNAFLPMWDGVASKGQTWVVGATNKRERIDEAIESRFGVSIEIGLPDAPERIQILAIELRKLESDIEVPEFVGKSTSGFAGRSLSKVAATVYRLAAQQGGNATDDIWRQAIGQFATSTSDAVDPNARWDSLILPELTIKRLKRIAEMLKHAETLREQGIEPTKGALLFGPPGTGKTQIAKTLANESGLNFIAAGPSDIKAGYLGQSGQRVRELFERARAKPTILFIDEIESGAASRNGGRADQFTAEIVTELLTQMEGVKKTSGTLFVLAATNHPKLVDEAVLSRFEDRVEIPNPGFDERRRMICSFIGRRRVDFDVEQVAQDLAARCEGLSGRDLMAAVRRASQQAAERAMDAGTPGNIVMSRDDLLAQLPSTDGRMQKARAAEG